MATSPRPGVGKRIAKTEAAQEVMTIRVRDRHYALAAGNVPFAIRTKVRKATGGIPFEQFMASDDRIGLDSLMVLVWVARLVAGEDVTIEDVEEQFDGLDFETELDVEQVTADEDDDRPES